MIQDRGSSRTGEEVVKPSTSLRDRVVLDPQGLSVTFKFTSVFRASFSPRTTYHFTHVTGESSYLLVESTPSVFRNSPPTLGLVDLRPIPKIFRSLRSTDVNGNPNY